MIEAVFIPLFALWRRETISPRVILWAGIVNKQAASGSNYCRMKLSVLEGNKISHGLIISHDTDEQDFTPHHREDKAGTNTAELDIQRCFEWRRSILMFFFFLIIWGCESG